MSSWYLFRPWHVQLVQETVMKRNSSPASPFISFVSVLHCPPADSLCSVIIKNLFLTLFSLFAIHLSLYISLVIAEDCWYPFSCCITSVLWSYCALPLSSLPKDHPNFCVQLWSQRGVFSKAWCMVSCVLQDTSDRWVQYRHGYICVPSVHQSWGLGH